MPRDAASVKPRHCILHSSETIAEAEGDDRRTHAQINGRSGSQKRRARLCLDRDVPPIGHQVPSLAEAEFETGVHNGSGRVLEVNSGRPRAAPAPTYGRTKPCSRKCHWITAEMG